MVAPEAAVPPSSPHLLLRALAPQASLPLEPSVPSSSSGPRGANSSSSVSGGGGCENPGLGRGARYCGCRYGDGGGRPQASRSPYHGGGNGWPAKPRPPIP